MKKLISIISIIAALAVVLMAIPVSAASVPATATVSGQATPPYIIATFSTPNNDNSTNPAIGPGVMPETVLPNASAPLFPPTDAAHDGWKMVKFYVLTADNSSDFKSDINGVSVTVNYPVASSTVSAGQTGYYVPSAEKFQLNASMNNGTWTAAQVYPTADYYPSVPFLSQNNGALATPPAWQVRVLTAGTGTDLVDMAADGNPNPGVTSESDDIPLATALTNIGGLVTYGTNPGTQTVYNATTAGNQFNAGKVLALELIGWIWFHQPAVTYTYDVSSVNTAQSANLRNVFHFIGITSLYADFTSINWGTIPNSTINLGVPGDTDLSTSGMPTVWDNGNLDAQLSIAATGLYLNGNAAYAANGATPDPAKRITSFDATLAFKDPNGNDLQKGTILFNDGDSAKVITLAPVGTVAGAPVLLKACNPGQIDFSLHSSNSYNVSGPYSGTITLTISQYPGASPY